MRSSEILVGREYALCEGNTDKYEWAVRNGAYNEYGSATAVSKVRVTRVGQQRWSDSAAENRYDGIEVEYPTGNKEVVPPVRIKARWTSELEATFATAIARHQQRRDHAKAQMEADRRRRAEAELREEKRDGLHEHVAAVFAILGINDDDPDHGFAQDSHRAAWVVSPDAMDAILRAMDA